MSHLERVIVLVDMDCFYCQVEEKFKPELKGRPVAVVQYNAWRGGGIIAVNYLAREQGVTRGMRGNVAQEKCPEIVLCQVPCVRGKADLTKYREAGKEVAAVLHKFTDLLQRASIDEAYLDITDLVNKRVEELKTEISPEQIPNTFIYGSDKDEFIYDMYNNSVDNRADVKLVMGGVIMEEIRAAVFNETGFHCSAGIAHNKILAKLSCGFHKPNKQTIIPHCNIEALYRELPVKKIRNLGGKFGDTLSEDLNITYMSELTQFTEKSLQQKYDTKTGSWLYNIARGIDMDPVVTRLCPKSIGCCKRFPGRTSLNTPEDLQHWLNELAEEIVERLNQDLDEYHRRATQMIVQYSIVVDNKNQSTSKTRLLSSYDPRKIADDSFQIIHKANGLFKGVYKYPVTFLGISTGKFEEVNKNIQSFFSKPINGHLETQPNLIENQRSIKPTECIQTKNVITNISMKNVSEKEQIDMNDKTNIKNILSNETNENQVMVDKTDTSSFFKKYLSSRSTNDFNEEIKNKNIENHPVENSESSTSKILQDQFNFCTECNKTIPNTEIDLHYDYHIALKLAATNDSQLQDNLSSQTVVRKQEEKRHQNSSIVNFFHKTDIKKNDVQCEENVEICDICKNKIPLSKFLEHLDFHTAKDLHKELNSFSATSKSADSKPTKNKVKREIQSTQNVESKRFKTISNFFKPLN